MAQRYKVYKAKDRWWLIPKPWREGRVSHSFGNFKLAQLFINCGLSHKRFYVAVGEARASESREI